MLNLLTITLKKILKNLIKLPLNLIFIYLKILRLLSFKSYHYLNETLLDSIQNRKKSINLDKKKIYIFTPNQLCEFRADTLFSKEPETINWINNYGKNAVLYDIGANIGLFSIYHSVINNSESYAFEPSVFNLIQLTKNININKCKNLVSVISNPLSNINSISEFNYSSIIEGGALSSFGVDYNFEGKKLNTEMSLNKLGFTIDELLAKNYLDKKPNLIKIDVDGIEHLILEGCATTLKDDRCKSVLVEINDSFEEQKSKSEKILIECGFKLQKKEQSIYTEKNKGFEKTFNQIWEK